MLFCRIYTIFRCHFLLCCFGRQSSITTIWGRIKGSGKYEMEKGFSERKGQRSKLSFTIHRVLFPCRQSLIQTPHTAFISASTTLEWETWCCFERALKSLSVMSGGTSIETLWILIRWSAYLNKEFLGSVCVSLADYHIWTPHSFKQSRSQTCGRGWRWWWRGHQYSEARYGKHYSKIKYQSEWKILAPVLTSITCNHIKSCKHARSVAWTGPDHRPQHQYVSSSLHFASVLLLSSLLILNIKNTAW